MPSQTDPEAALDALEQLGGRARKRELEELLDWSRARASDALRVLRDRGAVNSGQGSNPIYEIDDSYEPVVVGEEIRENFVQALKSFDGRTTNPKLIDKLGWSKQRYYEIRNVLIDEDLVATARGRGGVVELLPDEVDGIPGRVEGSGGTGSPDSQFERESDLYEPLREVIESDWAPSMRMNPDQILVEVTAHQGRRATGGTWSRPDISIVSFHKYKFLPDPVFDVVTVEVKPRERLDITGVYEAAAHGRFATRSFVLFHVGEEFDSSVNESFLNCLAEADRHGIGVITVVRPGDFETWETHSEGRRTAPDPIDMDKFIRQQLGEKAHETLRSWYASYWREKVRESLK